MSHRGVDKNAVDMNSLAKKIIEFGQNKDFEKLEQFISKCDAKLLEKTAAKRIGHADVNTFWNFLLIGFKSNSEAAANKRFAVIMSVLNEMGRTEITSKQSVDLITRLFIELPKLRADELIQLCEYCIDSLRMGDAKCTGWKDLFPEVIKILNDIPKLTIQGAVKSGTEYCDSIVKNLLTLKWPETVLTGIASMFLEMPLSKTDKVLVLNKLCENLQKLEPSELPTLSYQLFSLSTTPALLMIPLFSLDHYFHHFYYQKQFDDVDSDQSNLNNIDQFSDKELRQAQDTILYHLSTCSEYKIGERELVQQFRALASNPRYILTPFLLSALLTVCNVNRYLESVRLSVSIALPFIRTVIQNNEREREMSKTSAWSRNTLENSIINVEKVYSLLIDQSNEDVFTPGMVGLAFVLLKTTQCSTLNIMGIHFLEEFVKKRYLLGNGIVKKLKEFLFADQDAPQYAECLTRLSMTSELTISECVTYIKEILDFFLLIPGNHAMRMMTFIIPLIKISNVIRDHFIDILRRAMYQSDPSTRQMSVYGFCLILKQMRNNKQNLRNENNPHIHFDMSVLEIIGILRKCFNQTYDIKEVLYDGLTSATEQNPKIIAHVLQSLDWHFRSYFDVSESACTIKFNKCVSEIMVAGMPTLHIFDHVGKLLQFIARCIILCDRNDVEFETGDLKELFDCLIQTIDSVTLEHLGLVDTLTPLLKNIGSQYLNCLEGLMFYSLLKSRNIGQANVDAIIRLFDYHKECTNKLHDSSLAVKKNTRKRLDEAELTGISKTSSSPVVFKPENIWDVSAVHSFLEAICRKPVESNLFHGRNDFCLYVLNITYIKIEAMRSAPEYKQTKYSKSNFKHLANITAFILKYFVHNLVTMLSDSDSDSEEMACASVECLWQCLTTAMKLYQRKLTDLLVILRIPLQNQKADDTSTNLIFLLQNTLCETLDSFENSDVSQETRTIPLKLLQCLEMLYDNITVTEKQAIEIHDWLHNFCNKYNVDSDNMTVVHKLYFNQRIKTQNGPIFEGIAKQIEQEAGQIEDEPIHGADKLKSITEQTAESCVIYLCNSLRKQIEDIEYFILKAKSYCAKMKIGGKNEKHRINCEQRMSTIERRICSQLIFISRVCIHLANACLPRGQCMDNFVKLLTQYYICLASLAKHFIIRQKTATVSYKYTKFDQLVQTVGKRLPLRIYGIISYIEDNIFDEENGDDVAKRRKKTDPKIDKAKVMRDTKFIPKLILRIENFNKFIICLSKKTEHDLAKLLHMGTVRDFRIKTAALQEAIDKTFHDIENLDIDVNESENEEQDDDENVAADADDIDDDIDIANELNSTGSVKVARTPTEELIRSNTSGIANSTSSGSIIKEVENSGDAPAIVLKNLLVINKKANKRKQREIGSNNEAEMEAGCSKNNKVRKVSEAIVKVRRLNRDELAACSSNPKR